MAENNRILRPIFSLLSDNYSSSWIQEKPINGGNTIISFDGRKNGLHDIHKLIEWGDIELSGAIGLNWLSVTEGWMTETTCHGADLFSWHYHPSGSPLFSFQDWLSFLLSDAVASCVFTRYEICLYSKKKSDSRERLVQQLRKQWKSCGSSRPNLFFLRAVSLLENIVGFEISLDTFEAALERYLSVSLLRTQVTYG